jgi:hypothetical protein
MKKVLYTIMALMIAFTVLQSCSSKLCPAYGSYPEARGRK